MEQKMKAQAVSGHRGIFTEPPHAVPAGNVDVSGGGRWRIWQNAGTKIDAPILGNGDLLCAFAGPKQFPQFWFTTNDFWQMESAANWEFFHDNSVAKADPPMSLGSPKPVGRIAFALPELQSAKYRVEQNYETAETTVLYTWENLQTFQIRSVVCATENELLLEFVSDREISIAWDVRFPDETGMGCDIGIDFEGMGEYTDSRNGMFTGMVGGKPLQVKRIRDGVVSGWREFSDRVDVPTKVGFSGRFLETSDGIAVSLGCGSLGYDSRCSMKLQPGIPYHFVLSVRSWAKVSRPYEYACSRTRWFTIEDGKKLLEEHRSWWCSYWDVSGISIRDALLEKWYYLSQYMMGSLSRDPAYPPNILGISTFDRQAWNGNYKINYNHQSPYLGLMVAGHFAQSDPHDAPYLDLMDIAREMSRRLLGHDGVLYPLGLGPAGMVSEALLLYMKSPAVHGALNMIMRYQLTLDLDYGRKIYPFLLAVADFWEADLVLREDGYHVVGDGMHERVTEDVREHGLPEDPVNTLGYLQTFFEFMPVISKDLNLYPERWEKWKWMAAHMAPFPKGTIREITDNPTLWKESDVSLSELLPEEMLDETIFYDEGKGGKWSYHFPGNVMHIYPGNAIGKKSSEMDRKAAYFTIKTHALVEDALAEYMRKQDEESGKASSHTERERHFYKAGAWNADNLSCLFFPAAVRVGFDPDQILSELRNRILYRGMENGFIDKNPHGIENLSTVPNTLQEMMLQSYEGILRIFPNWPRNSQPEASFFGFRAYGAFLVDASLKDGKVEQVRIVNTKGRKCVVENPWGKNGVCIVSFPDGSSAEIREMHIELPEMSGEFFLRCK